MNVCDRCKTEDNVIAAGSESYKFALHIDQRDKHGDIKTWRPPELCKRCAKEYVALLELWLKTSPPQ